MLYRFENRNSRVFRGILLFVIVTAAAVGVFAQTPAQPGQVFASTGKKDGGRLLTIDITTGAATLVADMPGVLAMSGLAINSHGDIYGTDPNDPSTLYRVDAVTGAVTLIGNTGIGGVDGLAFDDRDVLYAAESYGQDSFHTLNVTTAAATFIGNFGILNYEILGMAFDHTTGVMYGSAGSADRIYTINLSTGTATLVGSTGLGGSVPDLFFDAAGNLYGSNGGTSVSDFTLISIDKATGAATTIGPTGFVSVSGLAAYNPSSATIPVTDPWGLGVLAVLLALAGFVITRRH